DGGSRPIRHRAVLLRIVPVSVVVQASVQAGCAFHSHLVGPELSARSIKQRSFEIRNNCGCMAASATCRSDSCLSYHSYSRHICQDVDPFIHRQAACKAVIHRIVRDLQSHIRLFIGDDKKKRSFLSD
ncbi:MAG: hypothetical protein K0Q81_1464, partial [Paenibacillus sp.]|nr:hypothetical protein [Paenibacillus sp.]